MKAGVLGSGIVGRVLGSGLLKHGYDAMLGTRDTKKTEVQDWLRENPAAKAGTFAEAAKFGEIIVLATLGEAALNAVELAGPANLSGKTVIDTTNPISSTPPVEGVLQFTTGPNESLAEKIQARIPEANVVKAFNSVGNSFMVNPRFEQGTPTMFLCGNKQRSESSDDAHHRAIWLGALRLRRNHRRPSHRAALHALVHSGLSEEPVDPRLQGPHPLVSVGAGFWPPRAGRQVNDSEVRD